MYPDPYVFRPERWLDSEGSLLKDSVSPMHPNKVVFGFGRRLGAILVSAALLYDLLIVGYAPEGT